jgi:short-subunit dehydrogenase
MDRAIILGASRGLGAALARHLCAKGYPTVGIARKEAPLAEIRMQYPLFEYRLADFSDNSDQEETLGYLLDTDFNRLFYVAGGGPYGLFHDQAWKSHLWSWEVTFQFAARVLHDVLAVKRDAQMVLVGSAVAESQADPNAASYCAAKHALKGLFQTVRTENPGFDLRLFSPGYMDTEMLPKFAAVRKRGVYDPSQMAEELWTWCLGADNTGHKSYSLHPK